METWPRTGRRPGRQSLAVLELCSSRPSFAVVVCILPVRRHSTWDYDCSGVVWQATPALEAGHLVSWAGPEVALGLHAGPGKLVLEQAAATTQLGAGTRSV